jgi:endo-1,3-1,4-beta-glycanase ExoK
LGPRIKQEDAEAEVRILRRFARNFGSAAIVLGGLAFSGKVEAKPYKGGELYSLAQYQYGRMEIRMRMARGSGILSTFFTYKNGSEVSGTFWEEIDIEVFGKDDAKSWQSNIITGMGTRTTSEEVHATPTSLADAYHTYALVWTPDYVAWELDGEEVRRTSSDQVKDLTNPQSFRFNLWAANIASWVGEFSDAVLPQYQFVNWISYSSYQNGQFTHEWTDEFDQIDAGRWAKANWTFAENLVDFDPNNVLVRDGTLVLAMTREGMTGFSGTVPVDPGNGGTGGSGGMNTGGSGGTNGESGGTNAGGGIAGSTGGANASSGGSGGGESSTGGTLSGSTGGAADTGGTAAGGTGVGGLGSGGLTPGAGGAFGAGGVAGIGGSSTDTPADPGGTGCSQSPSASSGMPRFLLLGIGLLLAAAARMRRTPPSIST